MADGAPGKRWISARCLVVVSGRVFLGFLGRFGSCWFDLVCCSVCAQFAGLAVGVMRGEKRRKRERGRRARENAPAEKTVTSVSVSVWESRGESRGRKGERMEMGGDAELAGSRQESDQEPFWALLEAIARPELLLDERCQGVAYGRDRMLRAATKNYGHVVVFYGNASPVSPEFGNPACFYRASSQEFRAILRVQHP